MCFSSPSADKLCATSQPRIQQPITSKLSVCRPFIEVLIAFTIILLFFLSFTIILDDLRFVDSIVSSPTPQMAENSAWGRSSSPTFRFFLTLTVMKREKEKLSQSSFTFNLKLWRTQGRFRDPFLAFVALLFRLQPRSYPVLTLWIESQLNVVFSVGSESLPSTRGQECFESLWHWPAPAKAHSRRNQLLSECLQTDFL
jgi:hypothetical protein